MGMAMEKEQLDSVGDYVKSHLADWIGDIGDSRLRLIRSEGNNSLGERIVRVEEGIKSQIELFNHASRESEKRFTLIREEMDRRFDQVDKQFEQVDKRFDLMQENMDRRFEQVDKRFDLMQENMDRRFEQVDKRFDLMQEEMNRRFEQVDKQLELIREDMDRRFDKVDKRFNRLYSFLTAIFVAMMGGFITVLVQIMKI